MQMFLAGYLQSASDARRLGIRFVALAPRAFLAGTPIGEAAAAAYGASTGPLDPDGVATAIVSIAAGDEPHDTTLLAVTDKGLEEAHGAS
jgi:hypothetical protein